MLQTSAFAKPLGTTRASPSLPRVRAPFQRPRATGLRLRDRLSSDRRSHPARPPRPGPPRGARAQDTWHNSIAPTIEPLVTAPVFHAIDYSAEKILSSGTAPLIVFASALVIWDLTIGVVGVMDALNRVHDIEEQRSVVRRVVVAILLAICVGVCLVGAVLVLIVAPRAGGSLHFLLGIGRWLVAVVLVGVAVGVLVRLAPAEVSRRGGRAPVLSW